MEQIGSHNCDSLEAGDFCSVSCAYGYVGTPAIFTCSHKADEGQQPDGEFPDCIRKLNFFPDLNLKNKMSEILKFIPSCMHTLLGIQLLITL